MFGWWKLNKRFLLAVAMTALLGVVGCGGVPPALPPPGQNIGNPGGVVAFNGSCGTSGGTAPLGGISTPYYSQLTPSGSTNFGDSMSLMLYSLNYGGGTLDSYTKSIVGSATMSLPSLQSLNSFPIANQQTTFCASATNPQGGSPIPGIFNSEGNFNLQLTLHGVVQVPLLSLYGSNNGAQGPEQVTINIGNGGDCEAFVSQGRIVGCIDVILGTQGYGTELQYYAQ